MFFNTKRIQQLELQVKEIQDKLDKLVIVQPLEADNLPQGKRRWTPREDEIVCKAVGTQLTTCLLSDILNRTEDAIKARAAVLGYSIKDYQFLVEKGNK